MHCHHSPERNQPSEAGPCEIPSGILVLLLASEPTILPCSAENDIVHLDLCGVPQYGMLEGPEHTRMDVHQAHLLAIM